MRNATGLLVVALLCGCGGGEEGRAGLCDRAEIEAALAEAAPGDTVQIGECAVDGPFRVPAGVTLAGEGIALTTVRAPAGSGAVALMPAGSAIAQLRDTTVRVEGTLGILTTGAGDARVSDVAVEVVRGIGIGASESTLVLERVSIVGPITGEADMDPRYVRVVPAAPPAGPCPAGLTCTCDPGATREDGMVCDGAGQWATITGTHGIWTDGATLRATDVTVTGLASFGALLQDTTGSWSGGAVTHVLGVGVRVVGGSFDGTALEVSDTRQGLRGTPAYGLAATDGAMVRTQASVFADNARYGLVQIDSAGMHSDLSVMGNGDAGLWFGGAPRIALDRAGITGNQFAGIVIVDSSDVDVRDAMVADNTESERAIGMFGTVRVGDGLHLVGDNTGVLIASSTFLGNERAGLVADLGTDGMAGAELRFEAVSVEATGSQLGAVAGTRDGDGHLAPVAPGTWDGGITRMGAAAENDMLLRDPLDAAFSRAPSDLPNPGEDFGVIAPMF